MRICYYNRLLNEPRGCGVHARSLVENWRRQGHEVLCLPRALTPPGPQVDSGVRDLSALPPFVRALAHEASARVRAARSASRLAGLVVEFAPDLLVTRRAGYDYCLDGVLAKTHLPYVVEGNAIVSQEAGEFNSEPVLAWEKARELAYLRRAAGVVCVTPELEARMLAAGVREGRTAVLPNGVDAQLFSPQVVPDEQTAAWSCSHRTVFGFVGSQLCSLHDLAGLMTVAAELVAQKEQVGLVFVGPTRSEIEDTGIWPSSLADRTLCTGRVPHSDVPKYLACADVLWASFLNDYGSPLKLYEYMAMAKPLLVAGAGEAVDAVLAAECGRAVDRGDEKGLLRGALELCRASGEERRAMGANGRAWILDGHTWSDVASRFVDLGVAMLAKA